MDQGWPSAPALSRLPKNHLFVLTPGTLGLSLKRSWYAEIGISCSWVRLKHDVPASGSMAPPTVTADTDSTGPNVWLGIGRRF
jgi:hypothetical protein